MKTLLSTALAISYVSLTAAQNSTILNPMLPGFYPDPSCIYVPEQNKTYFCASSTFLTFPGIPITASKDLQSWTLISHAFSRPEQLPEFAAPNIPTGGLWAPTLRYKDGVFYMVTTHVYGDAPEEDTSRWVNFILTTTDPYCSRCWSDPVYFTADGYDPSLFWDDDGQVYVTWAPYWRIDPGIAQATINLETGEVGPRKVVWGGSGNRVPEGPHTYKKDGWYYLLIAEGGTGEGHSVTIGRSKSINGPYESNPANPVLTNANTTEYFQAVGHADLFQDERGRWWGVALSRRTDRATKASPMGRESVLYPVTWEGEWPVLQPVRGEISSWEFPGDGGEIPGLLVDASEDVDFSEVEEVPGNFVSYGVSADGSVQLKSDGEKRGLCLVAPVTSLPVPAGNATAQNVTRLLRRQSHSLFTYSVDVDFAPTKPGQEAGVTMFIDPDNHLDLGIVSLSGNVSTPYLRFQGQSDSDTPEKALVELPVEWRDGSIRLEIKAFNASHVSFSAGPTKYESRIKTIAVAPVTLLQPQFTGTAVGVYVTANVSRSSTEACFTTWKYQGDGQFRS
ncbi:glycosyl hydrolase [Aspergillus avenaceus]|uniref:Glycosyl hydrolase n=1 Tax=Aspergillus avenaceus TaxID=36643 RepID=A0A5N6U1Y2_ASPAV|nr:glycosyl hydrolase [Aspergillus avenaceus]